jgi:hypothetical protein
MVWFHISAISQITKFNLGPMDFTKNYKPKKRKRKDFFDKVQKTHLPGKRIYNPPLKMHV